MSRHIFSLSRQCFSREHGFVVVADFFFIATELYCLVLLRLNSMSRQTFSMSRQSLLYSLSLAKRFVATLNPLSQQTCLGFSHLSSIFCHDRKLICRDRNLLLSNSYYRDIIFFCHDRDFCLQFFILLQHELLCATIFLSFS